MRRKLNFEIVKNIIENTNDNTLISKKYKRTKDFLDIKCKCGNIYKTTFGYFEEGKNMCDECSKKYKYNKQRNNYNDILDFINKNSTSKLLSKEYINTHDLLTFQCSCGKIFKTSWKQFKYRKKRTCNKCSYENKNKNRSKSNLQYTKEFNEKIGDEFELLSEYINLTTKVKVKHKLCGNIREVNPKQIITYGGCPICSSRTSKGEKKILDKLNNLSIQYTREKTFNNLKADSKHNLRFDFYIKSFNLLIEYDGIQHFKPINFNNKENILKAFMKRRKYDLKKNKFCKENNIKLVRISYYDYKNINKILEYLFKDIV